MFFIFFCFFIFFVAFTLQKKQICYTKFANKIFFNVLEGGFLHEI